MSDTRFDPNALAARLDGAGDVRGPELCGDIPMRIARDGTWFYHGSPIGRKPLIKLFARVLQRDANGDYWLVTPVERARIHVEDAPFVAVDVDVRGGGRTQELVFRTNVDDIVIAGKDHPIRIQDSPLAPYILVRAGLEALIARAVYYRLAERVTTEGDALGVWSGGVFFPIASD